MLNSKNCIKLRKTYIVVWATPDKTSYQKFPKIKRNFQNRIGPRNTVVWSSQTVHRIPDRSPVDDLGTSDNGKALDYRPWTIGDRPSLCQAKAST